MMANTNAVTLSVTLLLSLLFLLSNAVDVDPTSITTPRIKDEMTAVDSEPTAVVATASEVEVNPVERIVFRPAVESISAVNPDLIAHSFRIPFHGRAGRPRCRHGHADGLIRLPSGHPHRHFHHGEGFRFDMEEKEEKEFDEEELEHKRKKAMRKMTKERREEKDDENDSDDEEKMEEFEHKRKKMMKRMRFKNGKAEELDHEHEHEHKRMRRFRKERKEGGFMDRVHHFFNGFF